MYQLDIFSDIGSSFAGTGAVDGLVKLFNIVKDLIINFFDGIVSAIELIIGMFSFVPNLIINSMFSELPYVFKMGLNALFTIIMAMFILKLFQAIKFW